ncbi:four helix bundle protein [Luteolibacter flavescens]|uniref:Four helix bundle protein n=1 Tax=Luteolibacter flavescens TaxID=1859460 RepID=A0ABT3FHZ0_9BACT|nr:four helix bundle protein [Luteolibacter flavescens]MCW1883188.1 four helix bundle protein [Luteolibacter flavescens]
MPLHHFEELEVWKRSSRLAVSVLELIEPVKLYALRDQMARCCISVPSNIAEGAERESNREFRRFLAIAKGSAGELRTQLYIGIRAGCFSNEVANPLIEETKQIASMIEGLRKKLGGGGFVNLLFGWLF